MPTVAYSPVVGPDAGYDGRAPDDAATLQDDPQDLGQLSCDPIPRSSGGSTSFRQEFSLSRTGHDLDDEDLEFLSKHLASQTASGYGYSIKRF